MNKVVAETAYANIVKVGMPKWTDADQTLAKAVQKELGVEEKGLPTEIAEAERARGRSRRRKARRRIG